MRLAFNNDGISVDVESPHTTCFYMDETRKPRKGLIPDEDESIVVDSSVAGIPGQKSSHRPFFLDLARVRDLIETFVQKDMAARKRDPLEIQGLWKPNIVVANCYRGHDQGVGQHADRLTYIGPRPTIASLTLGAKRAFRIRKIQQGDGSPARFYDVKLPHNSLLIMSPPMQVCLLHTYVWYPTDSVC